VNTEHPFPTSRHRQPVTIQARPLIGNRRESSSSLNWRLSAPRFAAAQVHPVINELREPSYLLGCRSSGQHFVIAQVRKPKICEHNKANLSSQQKHFSALCRLKTARRRPLLMPHRRLPDRLHQASLTAKSNPLSMVKGKGYSALRNAWIVPFI
jgi:hypothetical protein